MTILTEIVFISNKILLPVLLIGCLGNGLQLVSLFRFPLASKITNTLVRCQCLADGLICLLNFITILLTSELPHQGNQFPSPIVASTTSLLVCHLWHTQFVHWYLVVVSVQTLVATAIDRFCAVVRPRKYASLHRHGPLCLIGILLYAALFTPQVAFTARLVNDTVCTNRPAFDSPALAQYFRVTSVLWPLFIYILPSILFLIIYGRIILVLRRGTIRDSRPSVASISGDISSTSTPAARQLTKAIIIITAIFILTFSMDAVNTFISMQRYAAKGERNLMQRQIALALIVVNSCANTFVYLIYLRSFRRNMIETLLCRGINCATRCECCERR